MKDLTSTSFGYIIAFLLPGMFGLYAVSFWSPPASVLMQPVLKADTTVGPSIVLLLIAVGVGVWISAARWVLFEEWMYRKRRLPADMYKSFDSEKLTLHKTFAEEHYRYHQFYGGCAISLLILFAGWAHANWQWDAHTAWVVVGFVFLEVLLERAASDTYGKYTDKCKAIAASPAAGAKEPLSNPQFRRRQEFQTGPGQKFPAIACDLTGTRYLREVQRHYALATASRLRCRYRFTKAKLAHSR